MFTGLVQHLGTVTAVVPGAFGARLDVDAADWGYVPAAGASVAVNGCCLTAVDAGAFRFDVVRQTLENTTLGDLAAGAPVNLEHAVTPATLLGGHLVQGHVDGVAVVTAVTRDETQWRVRVAPPPALMRYVVDRGSICLDGVSLTIAATGAEWLEVALIPTTLAETTLGSADVGTRLNVETDCVARMVGNWLERRE